MQENLIKEYNQIKRTFAQNFKTTFLPIAQKYEKLRKILVCVAVLIDILSIGYWFYLAFFSKTGVISIDSDTHIFLMLPVIVHGAITATINLKIKKEIMPEVCKCIGNLTWSQGKYKNPEILSQAKIISNNYNSIGIDDVVQGVYKDVTIDIVEGHYYKGRKERNEKVEMLGEEDIARNIVRRALGIKKRKCLFNGVFIVLNMNKNFKGHTIIRPDKLLKNSPSPELKLTTLEDVTFEKKYDVFTDDEIEARYLITTSFMNRLNDLKVAFKAKKVSCAFYKGDLIIAFNEMKDLFTVFSLFKATDNSKQYAEMFEEFLSIVKIIDHFKLNEKIGL